MKKMLFGMLAAVVLASCNKEENVVPQAEPQSLNIKLNLPQTRAVEDPIATGTQAVVKDMIVYFYKADGGAATPASRSLTAAEITAATSTEGLKIVVNADVTQASMRANLSLAGGSDNAAVTLFQNLGANADGFTKSVPMTSPKASITNNAVTLVPVPDMARVEVLGKITPVHGYESVKVNVVNLNNYYTTAKKTTLQKYENGNWGTFEPLMKDALTGGEVPTGKAAAYQIFPSTTLVATHPHVVLELTIKPKNGVEATKRYITITKYKDGTNALTSFEGGKIYKLNLSSLNHLFTTDDGTDNGNPVDPTDNEPELEKADLTINVTTYEWTSKDITPDI